MLELNNVIVNYVIFASFSSVEIFQKNFLVNNHISLPYDYVEVYNVKHPKLNYMKIKGMRFGEGCVDMRFLI